MQPNAPLVLVVWKDANTGNDDVVTKDNVDQFHKPTIVSTLGWLLKNDDEGITLVNEFYEDCFRGRTFIFKPMIVSVTPFNLVKPRKAKPKSPPESP